MGFSLARFLRRKHLDAFEAVRRTTPNQLGQSRALRVRGRDDQLAALLVRDAVLATEPLHLANAVDGEPRLERSRGVVEARVEHAAVVATLMLADLRFLLEDDDPPVTIGVQQLVCSRETNDSAADDYRRK